MNSSKIHIGNLAFDLTEQELKDHLSQYGRVTGMKYLPRNGFANIELATPGQAEEIIAKLNKTEFKGREMRIDYLKETAKPAKPAKEETSSDNTGHPKPFYRSKTSRAPRKTGKETAWKSEKPVRKDNRPGYAESEVNKPAAGENKPSRKFSRAPEGKPRSFSKPYGQSGKPSYSKDMTSDSSSYPVKKNYDRSGRSSRYDETSDKPAAESRSKKPYHQFSKEDSSSKPRTYGKPGYSSDKPRTYSRKPENTETPGSFDSRPAKSYSKPARDFSPGKPRNSSGKTYSKNPRSPKRDNY